MTWGVVSPTTTVSVSSQAYNNRSKLLYTLNMSEN